MKFEIYIGNELIEKVDYPDNMTPEQVRHDLINNNIYTTRIQVKEVKNDSSS